MKKLFFLHLCLFNSISVFAQSTEPMLRIETGMHTAIMRRISVDAAEQYLVTASDDKTVRIWSLDTGELIRTLRLPIDYGNEGKVYCAAIAPDGSIIACAGWTGTTSKDGCIYIFERNSGRLLHRIATKQEIVINHLAFSCRGEHLLAICSGTSSYRLYRCSDYQQIAADQGFQSSCYWGDFCMDGRFATASYDGFIRLYNADGLLLATAAAEGGKEAFGIAFSPDGQNIAVGFSDSKNVDIFSVKNNRLFYSFSTDVSGVSDDSDLFTVCWSADGRNLFAAGSWQQSLNNEWRRIIRRWDDSGLGRYQEFRSTNDRVMQLFALSNGDLVIGAADPQLGVMNRNGNFIYRVESGIGDFRNQSDKLLISFRGTVIQFGFQVFGNRKANFSLESRQLVLNPASNSGLQAMDQSTLNVTDWQDLKFPKLNGQALSLQAGEKSRSLAIHPDGRHFLLGCDWSLRYFDSSGKELWQNQVPAVTWAVNISGNGRLAAAAYGDGTIHWYRLFDGQELLTLFPHSDGKRWVVWTPSGYYDASIGGEELIGWHVNNGREQAADFYPASRFRSVYYRPDVIDHILESLDESEALRLANESAGRKETVQTIQTLLPPVIDIVTPEDGTTVYRTPVTFVYEVRTPSEEPVIGVRALIDGRPAEMTRGIQVVSKSGMRDEMTVAIPARDCEVSLIAENRYGASVPSSVRLKWLGTGVADIEIKPKMYILGIGISTYNDPALQLGFAAKDARDVIASLQQAGNQLYREIQVRELTDINATKDNILDGLEWIQRETTSRDVAVIFLAGHGINDMGGIFYFLPVNADLKSMKRTCLPFSDLRNTVMQIAGKVVVFTDACHSGSIMGARRGSADITEVVNELSSAENGAIVFTSSTGRQYSLEDQAWGNGAFSRAVSEGLIGKADYNGDKRITIKELDLYVSERVKELTRGEQSPTTIIPANVPDFPLVLKGN